MISKWAGFLGVLFVLAAVIAGCGKKETPDIVPVEEPSGTPSQLPVLNQNEIYKTNGVVLPAAAPMQVVSEAKSEVRDPSLSSNPKSGNVYRGD